MGIYIHIPFCKQKCHYCDFHFSTSLKNKKDLITCLLKEIEIQKSYLNEEIVETIYFGGGTPSFLNAEEIRRILNKVYAEFDVISSPEITLEGNPDDFTFQKLQEHYEKEKAEYDKINKKTNSMKGRKVKKPTYSTRARK